MLNSVYVGISFKTKRIEIANSTMMQMVPFLIVFFQFTIFLFLFTTTFTIDTNMEFIKKAIAIISNILIRLFPNKHKWKSRFLELFFPTNMEIVASENSMQYNAISDANAEPAKNNRKIIDKDSLASSLYFFIFSACLFFSTFLCFF